MTASSDELQVQRDITKWFIDMDPVVIALIPRDEVRTASGAFTMVDGSPRAPQTFKKIPMSHTERPADSTSTAISADRGVMRKYEFTLLGEWDAIIRENDWWADANGQRWVVDAIVPYNGYEVKALITSYGRKP